MIHGHVVGLQMRVNVPFRLPAQPDVAIEFVIDTGFQGELTLPRAAVAALGLSAFQQIVANLADGRNVRTAAHLATILWDGVEREVAVLALGARPLLGTGLLQGYALHTRFIDGAAVIIEKSTQSNDW
ncbi:clan AA aspartic protease [Gloeobacter morelensis]|uniref:Clan AA aspartic protease n=1 Tax=Gloeobacter morelensis MG652769 TaxID=2781736 RepID=A0ABY3PIX6_9CYAN|nr:clan AA aspartic protease [Gloeobacter morelensis]UFP93622.1 clan AA aspartic protease [Gloeobacter morelensis MG652769]